MKRATMVAAAAAVAILLLSASLAAQQRFFLHSPDRAFLGVQIRDVGAEDVRDLNLPREAGVYVERVHPESPAHRADIREGDVIMEFAGVPVMSVRQFQRKVAETPPGRQVQVNLLRNGEALTRSLALGGPAHRPGRAPHPDAEEGRWWMPQMPDFSFQFPDRFREDPGDVFVFSGQRGRLGITGSDLTGQMAEFLNVPGDSGVLVMSVREDSPAQRAGLRAGDVIVAVNGEQIRDLSQLSRQVSQEGSYELDVVRDGQVRKMTVELGRERERRGRGTTRL
jgi:serine protease Do